MVPANNVRMLGVVLMGFVVAAPTLKYFLHSNDSELFRDCIATELNHGKSYF